MYVNLQDTIRRFAELLLEEERVKKTYAQNPRERQSIFIDFGVKKLTFILQVQGLDSASAEKLARVSMEPADKMLSGLFNGMDDWLEKLKDVKV